MGKGSVAVLKEKHFTGKKTMTGVLPYFFKKLIINFEDEQEEGLKIWKLKCDVQWHEPQLLFYEFGEKLNNSSLVCIPSFR